MRSLFYLGFLVASKVQAQADDDLLFDIANSGEGVDIDHKSSVPADPPKDVVVDYVKGVFQPPDTPASALIADVIPSDKSLDANQWKALVGASYQGEWDIKPAHPWFDQDHRLKMNSAMKHHGIARALPKTWSPEDGALFGSLEVLYPAGHTCGGAYFKLFNSADNDPTSLDGTTPYSIMFGPDHCGVYNNKVHLILQKDVGAADRKEFAFKKTPTVAGDRTVAHQYGFALYKNSTFKLFMDESEYYSGSFQEACEDCFKSPEEIPDPDDVAPEDWVPPPATIPDPDAVKPEDWDESQPEFIPDLDAEMPEGWNEDAPIMIPNPEATKPEDWDDVEDGEWEVPLTKNPACRIGCGKWEPTKRNPLYKGPWVAPTIPNPDYTPTYPRRMIKNTQPWDISNDPFGAIEPFNAIGFEVWNVEAGVEIDNIYLGTNEAEFMNWVKSTRANRLALEAQNKDLLQQAQAKAMEIDSEKKDTPPSTSDPLMMYGAAGAAAMFVSGGAVYLIRKRRAIGAASVPSTGADKKTDEPSATEEKKVEKMTSSEKEKDTEHTTAETEVDDNSQLRRRKPSDDHEEKS